MKSGNKESVWFTATAVLISFQMEMRDLLGVGLKNIHFIHLKRNLSTVFNSLNLVGGSFKR
jgi:hypothetical protein